MVDLSWAAATHAGRVRERNEDAILARPPLFIVADGMGGHDAGDVAATTVVEALAELAARDDLSRLAVLDAVREANVRLAALGGRTGRTMGTTVCGLVALPPCPSPRFVLFNVGDSRVYRLRHGSLSQLTHDHSQVQELVDAGAISPAQARRHPARHVVTRSLGSDDYLAIDWWTITPERGDRFLVASDGLTNEVDDETIAAILTSQDDPDEATGVLVDAALARGGRDNVSVIVVDVATDGGPVSPAPDADPLDADTRPRPEPTPEPDTVPGPERVPWDHRWMYADTEPQTDA
jgi:serine/threonine protein phosphatase PrpC